jgi:hypothetical protein
VSVSPCCRLFVICTPFTSDLHPRCSFSECSLLYSSHQHVTCRLKSESEALRSELDSHHSTSMARERDIEKAREELQEAKREAADRVRALEEEAQVAKLAAEQYGQQMEILKGDALKFQATARAAHGSYERELQLHAKAERDLKDMEAGADTLTSPPLLFPTIRQHTILRGPYTYISVIESVTLSDAISSFLLFRSFHFLLEMDTLKEALVAAQHTAADLTAASIRQERALHEERARVAQSEAEVPCTLPFVPPTLS